MGEYLFSSALGLFVQAVLPLLGALLVGGVLIGILQSATLIRDESLSLAGKLGALILLALVAAGSVTSPVLEFTRRMWGGADLFQ